jgi:hypothetical protein
VWFPGYGWQDFDPTAAVAPVAPSPGATALHDVGSALRRIPVVPVVAVIVLAGLGVVVVRWRRLRPATWAEAVARRAERAGRRAGRPRQPAETLMEYAARLDALSGPDASTWVRLALSVEASAYGGQDPPPAEQRALVAEARRAGRGARGPRTRASTIPTPVPPERVGAGTRN